MKDSTKDFIAIELVIIAFIIAAWFPLASTLMMFGISLFPTPLTSVLLLYGLRWICWAMEYARHRAHLRARLHWFVTATGAAMTIAGLLVASGGVLAKTGGGEKTPLLVMGGVLVLVGMGLIFWAQERCKPQADANPVIASATEASKAS